MLRTLEATQYISQIASGRNRPLLAAGEDADGNVVEVVLKFSSACERGSNALAVEVVAACLAGHLELPIPEPFIVEISPAWRASLPADVRGRLSDFDNLAFGSKLIYPQWPVWAVTNRLSPAMVQTAAEILAFDGFIENVDRLEGNPNCLVSGEQLRIIDHELAFPQILFGLRPWQPGSLQPYCQPPSRHIFREHLLRKDVDHEAIREKWAGLQDREIDDYRAAVPHDWSNGDFLEEIVTKIRQVRDNLAGCMTEFERILQ